MNRIQIHLAIQILACASVVFMVGLAAQETARSPEELTREQKEQFLLHAEIGKARQTKIGVTGSRRATLSDATLTHDAHIQTVDIYEGRVTVGRKTEFGFRDYWGFNVAGYRLDKLLELNIVPVTVERRIRRDKAAVGWWIDGVMMNGIEFRDRDFESPPSKRLRDQRDNAWAFQQLIFNTDPNLGNVVIDEDWKGWIFDFTRAFRRWEKLDKPESLKRIGRGFLSRLRELDPADVEREVGPYLKPPELKGLLARRDLMVRHFERLIAEKGEFAVLIEGEGF